LTMAKIHEEVVVIKLSKLVKDNDTVGVLADSDVVTALQSVAEELLGAGVIVEAERAQ
jgi:hypothetical protein